MDYKTASIKQNSDYILRNHHGEYEREDVDGLGDMWKIFFLHRSQGQVHHCAMWVAVNFTLSLYVANVYMTASAEVSINEKKNMKGELISRDAFYGAVFELITEWHV